MAVSPLAPDPEFQERAGTSYMEQATSNPTRQGTRPFEEGIATDTDVPNEFVLGAMQGYKTGPNNTNANVFEKSADETMRERAHVGSAAWPEAPTYLSNFATGASGDGEVSFVQEDRGEGRKQRRNYARVSG